MVLTYEDALKLVNQIWKSYDDDGNGLLEREESQNLLRDIAVICDDESILQQSDEILALLDSNGDGKLSKEELLSLLISDI